MELRQLRYLVVLAEERHFTRAAARVHIAQPALSQQIRRLEDELGLPLVDRTTRQVALTEAGELLVDRARRALAEVDAAQAELSDLAGVRAGHVVVGAMQSLGPFDLSALLAAFHAAHPGVDLTVREDVSDALLAMVRRDEVELAFLSVAERLRDGDALAHERLLTERLVLLVATTHHLARRGRVALGELRDEDFITFREGAGLRRAIVTGAHAAGFDPHIVFETNEVARARALTARGLGVTIVPASDAEDHGPPLAVLEVDEPALSRDITLVWRHERRLTPAARAFLELARSADDAGEPHAARAR